MACRWGQFDIFSLLIAYECEVRISDDSGRTPLHDACLAAEPNLLIVETLLKVDKRMMFFADSRGMIPMAYVRKPHWAQFTRFFMLVRDDWWPNRDVMAKGKEKPPRLARKKPNSRPVPVPKRQIPLDIARQLASGDMMAAEWDFMSK